MTADIIGMAATLAPLAVAPGEAARLAGLGRTTVYEAIGTGELRSIKIGSRRLIMVEAIRDWLNSNAVDGADAGGGRDDG